MKSASEEIVITPGGERLASMVHLIQPGTSIDVKDMNLRQINAENKVIKTFGKLERREPTTPDPLLSPRESVAQAIQRDASGLKVLRTGWITCAYWNNNGPQPVTFFTTTWKVPPPPISRTPGLIYLFNGIQNRGASDNPAMQGLVVQPVLQWGSWESAGGAYWSVASWFVTGSGYDTPVFRSESAQVQPGDTLRGVINGTRVENGLIKYSWYFEIFNQERGWQKIPTSGLTMTNSVELRQCVEALECYRMQTVASYPTAFCTRMRDIAVLCGIPFTRPVLEWTPENFVTDCGQHTVIIDHGNGLLGGEVHLCYGTIAPERVSAVFLPQNEIQVFTLGPSDMCIQKSLPEGRWQNLEGSFETPVTAVSRGQDRIELFGIGLNHECYHKSYNNAWDGGWESLHGQFAGPISAVCWSDDRIDVFGIGMDGCCYHRWWNENVWRPLNGWANLGGHYCSPITAVTWGKGRLDIFALGLIEGQIHCGHGACNAGNWNNDTGGVWTWVDLGGDFISPPSALCPESGRIELFGVFTGKTLRRKSYRGGWQVEWVQCSDTGVECTSAATVVSLPNQRFHVFCLKGDGGIHHMWSNDGAWTIEKANLRGPFNSRPALCPRMDAMDMFVLGRNRLMNHGLWGSSGGWVQEPDLDEQSFDPD